MNDLATLIEAVRQLPSLNPPRWPEPRMTDAKLAARRGYQLSGQPGERR